MKPHELATIFPEMSGDEIRLLSDDIKENGQREKIVLLDDRILDGRSRYAACQMGKVKPATRKFGSEKSDGKDPLKFVISMNLNRRHLSDDQRALIAAEMSKSSERGRPADEGSENGVAEPIKAPTQKEAAELMNVPQSAVKRASAVIKKGSAALKDSVKKGKTSLSKAAKATKAPKKRQMKAATAKPAKKKEAKESPKEKLLVALDQLWINNRDKWNASPMVQPAGMVRHFQKLINEVL